MGSRPAGGSSFRIRCTAPSPISRRAAPLRRLQPISSSTTGSTTSSTVPPPGWSLGDTNPLAVAGQVGKVVVVGVLAAFIVAGGRRVVDSAIRFTRRTSIREELHDALSQCRWRVPADTCAEPSPSACCTACVAGLVSWALGLPGPISIAAWVAVASTVPILGGLLAWLPIVALATGQRRAARRCRSSSR